MPTQRFNGVHPATVTYSALAPALPVGRYAVPIMTSPATKGEAMSAEADWPAEAFVDLHALGKGVVWALLIEGVAAFCFYAVWQLLH